MVDISFHEEHLEEKSRNLAEANESIWVSKRKVIELPMNLSRPKHASQTTKMIVESMEERYHGIRFQIESVFTA